MQFTRLGVAVVAAGLIAIASTPSASAAPPPISVRVTASSASTADTDEVTLPDGAEFGGLNDVKGNWYITEEVSGDVAFVWGPGVTSAPKVGSTTTKVTTSTTASAPSVRAAATVCQLLVSQTFWNDNLNASSRVTCNKYPDGITQQGYFQRKNAAGIYVRYSPDYVSNYGSGQEQIWNWRTICGARGSQYYYRLRARANTGVGGTSAWYAGARTNTKYFCGT